MKINSIKDLWLIQKTLLVCLLISLAVNHSYAQSSKKKKTRISIDRGGKSTYHWQDGRHSLKIEFEGEIEWMNDDDGIESMTRGSYLEIEEKGRGGKHYVRIEPAANGGITYAYRYNGKRKPFDEEANLWLTDVLPKFIRESGIGAESRTRRILGISGVDGVLNEVDMIGSPSVKVLYLLHLFDQAEMSGSELGRTARTAEEISSPGDKTRFLIATAEYFLVSEDAYESFFDTAESISSPGDKTRLLIHLVDEDLLVNSEVYSLSIKTAHTISSPGDRSRFLIKAAPFFVREATDEYMESVRSISSPGDKARVLIALLEQEGLDRVGLNKLLSTARTVSSPGDKSRVLIAAADQMDSPVTRRQDIDMYLDTVESISSPGDRSKVLIHLVESVEMRDGAMLAWLQSVETVSSPGDKTRVLLRVVDQLDDDELIDAYIEAAETISSPGDRRRALEALIN